MFNYLVKVYGKSKQILLDHILACQVQDAKNKQPVDNWHSLDVGTENTLIEHSYNKLCHMLVESFGCSKLWRLSLIDGFSKLHYMDLLHYHYITMNYQSWGINFQAEVCKSTKTANIIVFKKSCYMVSNFVHTWAKYKHNGRHVEQKFWEIPESIFDKFLYMYVSKLPCHKV